MERDVEDLVAFYHRVYRKNGTLKRVERIVGVRQMSSIYLSEVRDIRGNRHVVKNNRIVEPTDVERTAWRLGI